MKLIGINADTRQLRWPIGAAYVARFRMRAADGAVVALAGRNLAMSIHSGARVIAAVAGVPGSDDDGDYLTFAFGSDVTALPRRSCQWEIAELFVDGKQPLIEGAVYFAPAAPAAPGGEMPDVSFDAVEWTAPTDVIVAVLTGAPGKDGAGELVDGVAYFGEAASADDGGKDRHWETYPAVPPDPSRFPAWIFTAKSALRSIVGWFTFTDSPKPQYYSFVRSRGNGLPGTPGYYKASQPNDRLITFGFYGSSDANAAHAGYLRVLAAENCVNNELASVIGVNTANSRTNGNGWMINPWAQMIVPGPNMLEPLPYDAVTGKPTDFGGIVVVGPGSTDWAQERMHAGVLPAAPKVGTRNFDGRFWAVDSSGRHQRFVLQEPLTLALIQVFDPSVATATMRQGLDWVEVTLTMATDYAAGGVIVRVSIAPPADGSPAPVPAVVGSVKSTVLVLPYPNFTYEAKSNVLIVSQSDATPLKAGAKYIFTMIWRWPT